MSHNPDRLRPVAILVVMSVFGGLPGPGASTQAQAVTRIAGHQDPEIATDPAFRELKGGLLEGIPDFPAYPGATLIGSAERNRPDEKNRGYRIKWTTRDAPARVMAWYAKTLPRHGWTYVPEFDAGERDELEARIANAAFTGYIEAETEDFPHRNVTDVVVVLARK